MTQKKQKDASIKINNKKDDNHVKNILKRFLIP
jgi:hypothetical protein